MNNINIKDLLKGLVMGEKQQVGIMSVIPLIGEDATKSVADFNDMKFVNTVGYGSMCFSNNSDKPFIIPTSYAVITKQLAQDHALPFAMLLKPKAYNVNMNMSCCIQRTQCGLINGEDIEDFGILPLYIRKENFKSNFIVSNEKLRVARLDFSRLWEIIADFQEKLINERVGNLVLFFNKFVSQLNKFNSEFETVDGQRGAIILLNDKVVGIEIVPTQAYWKTIWQSLVRDCYGSEVIRRTMGNLIEEFEKHNENDLSLDECKTIQEIKDRIKEHSLSEHNKIHSTLEDVLNKDIIEFEGEIKNLNRYADKDITYHMFKFKEEQNYGELYTESDNIIYASVLF